MDRRGLMRGGALAAAGLVLGRPGMARSQTGFASPPAIVPIHATPDRLFRVTVCTRPFRAAGPRIEVEQVGRKRVVHHYGHGGSGWSLSWGSAQEAVPLALADGVREVAVIGAGAIGLTTAITAQRMGAKVTIYAKERFPYVRSARATGSWTPDSRIAIEGATAADFATRWERMARAAFQYHQSFLGTPGDPVEWVDRYSLMERHHGASAEALQAGRPQFATFGDRIRDITPSSEMMVAGTHPFDAPVVRRTVAMTFNVADLARQLEHDFLISGGRFVPAEFHEPADLARIREKVVINCTGYGARALFRDESVVPVRGQIAWLLPQRGAFYGLYHDGLSILARRDGIVLQPVGADDYFGYGDDSEVPDYAAAYEAVAHAARLFRPRGAPSA
ncbi:FAD-dependent oxidoreductase [Sphingomonas sp. ID0503]|uniref:FAD-dependent oxidoreductase n=1 Tax=Sphingomonas sp. ID0503 TaxID=3399691 RepID=UPI003AFB509B